MITTYDKITKKKCKVFILERIESASRKDKTIMKKEALLILWIQTF